jgi:putative ABC transport system permease protein
MPLSLCVLVYQSAALALSQIWANKTRSVLTMLGIIIGVASVTAVIGALTGLQTKVLDDFGTFGTNKVFLNPERPSTGPRRNVPWSEVRFRPEEFEGLLEACPSVKALTRQSYLQLKVRHADRIEDNVRVVGIEPAWHLIENRSVTLGRPFSLVDERQGRAVALVNPAARDKLRLPRECVGASIMVGDRRFTVIGVVEPEAQRSIFGGSADALEIFIPFKTAMNMRPNNNISVVTSARSPDVSEDARAEILFFLRNKRHIRPGELDTFRVDAVQKFIDTFKDVSRTMTLVAAGIVGISLIVGGVGIMNIMLVSVSERTREIGLRKAVGARPSAILLQFLVEAVTLCLFGGLLGIIGGEAIATLIAKIPGTRMDRAEVPLWAIAVSFCFCAVVGLVFGMFPAIKASRLDPIEALRHE